MPGNCFGCRNVSKYFYNSRTMAKEIFYVWIHYVYTDAG